MLQWNTRGGNIWRVSALFSTTFPLDSVDDVRRCILSHYVALVRQEETLCKLPSLFCSALLYGGMRIQGDAVRRFESFWHRHHYHVVLPLCMTFRHTLAYDLDPLLVEVSPELDEAHHFMVLNLFALLLTSPSVAAQRHTEQETRLIAVLLTLAKRFKYGDVVWFYAKHVLELTADTVSPRLIDKELRELLVTYFLRTVRQSEILLCTVLPIPFESRAVSLYRILVMLFLAENEIRACIPLIRHIEKTIDITYSQFYLVTCQVRYPAAYSQLINETMLYLSSSTA